MGLFDKQPKKRSGNIPETLGISQERADQLIGGVKDSYRTNDGDINKCMDEIKAEKLTPEERDFAMYALGAVKIVEGKRMMDEMPKELLGFLEKLAKDLE